MQTKVKLSVIRWTMPERDAVPEGERRVFDALVAEVQRLDKLASSVEAKSDNNNAARMRADVQRIVSMLWQRKAVVR